MNAVTAPRRYTEEVDLTFTDTLSVECDYIHGEPRTRDHPGEAGGLVPVAVFWRGIEITRLLDPSEMDDITEKLNAR